MQATPVNVIAASSLSHQLHTHAPLSVCLLFESEEANANRQEIESIDEKLKELCEKQAQLQKSYDSMLSGIKGKEHNKGEAQFVSANLPHIRLVITCALRC